MLDEIIKYKPIEVKGIPEKLPLRNKEIFNPISYLKTKPFIAEVKKASPSAGDINLDISPVKQALLYEQHGAGAISVLTDKRFFKGSFEYLKDISENVSIPVLCKDFIISEKQIDAAYAFGADMILLIAAILSEDKIRNLSDKAAEKGLYVLYEIHKIEEFEKIRHLSPKLVGVNSRDLKTFEINKKNACYVLENINGDFLKIAESGINSVDDIVNFKKSGADAFLVGTYLMKSGDIESSFRQLYKGLE